MKMTGSVTNGHEMQSPCDEGSAEINRQLNPTKLMVESFDENPDLTLSHTFASTPSPKNATADEENDLFVHHSRRVRKRVRGFSLVDSALGLRKIEEDESKQDLARMLFGCLFAYVILGVWIWTIIRLIDEIGEQNCEIVYTDALEGKGSPSLEPCVETFTGKLACAHSIVFGLISAVVIHETSGSNKSANQRLSSIVQPILNRRADNANIIQRTLCSVTLLLPALYVVCWSGFGLWCFIFSVATPDGSSGPLFYTGQTWLGITVRASYAFFDVSESSDEPSRLGAPHDTDVESGHVQRC